MSLRQIKRKPLYVEHQLAPALKPGQIVRQENSPPDCFLILLTADNLSSHKSLHVQALLRAQGIHLHRQNGSLVPSPFLNLGAELWDRSQTRLTLIFDPGRIKQGVGPNTLAGAPLIPGKGYSLVVSGQMKSAAGVELGADHVTAFRAGPANRHALTPEDWHVLLPSMGTTSAMTVTFDRIMDNGAVRRLLRVLDPAGQPLRGRIATDGQTWSFTPEMRWQPGSYQLELDPALEDVSGNTTRAVFDSATETIGRAALSTLIDLSIGEE